MRERGIFPNLVTYHILMRLHCNRADKDVRFVGYIFPSQSSLRKLHSYSQIYTGSRTIGYRDEGWWFEANPSDVSNAESSICGAARWSQGASICR